MEELILLSQEVQALRMFVLVNREAVRKILKKLYKKTSEGCHHRRQRGVERETLLAGTELDTSHEASRTLSAVNVALDEMKATIAKSRAP